MSKDYKDMLLEMAERPGFTDLEKLSMRWAVRYVDILEKQIVSLNQNLEYKGKLLGIYAELVRDINKNVGVLSSTIFCKIADGERKIERTTFKEKKKTPDAK